MILVKHAIHTNVIIRKLLCFILFVLPCCLLTSCAGNKEQVLAFTDEFSEFLEVRRADNSDTIRESFDGYQFTLEKGRFYISDKDEAELWSSKNEWYVDSFKIADVNCDGILDIVLVLWKSYSFGADYPARMENADSSVKCHLFVYSIKDNRIKSLWCSSNLPRPIYSLELTADGEQTPTLSGVRLITQEGSYTEDYRKMVSTEYIYEWNGWGFSPTTTPVATTSNLSRKPMPDTSYATLAVVGDLMCHEAQFQDALVKGGDIQCDFNYAFKYIAPYISSADYAIGNFETTIALPENKSSDFPVFGAPTSFAEAIKTVGFDFVTTANNHALDFGIKGLEHTLQVLDELDIKHTGTYTAESDSQTIAIVDVNNITFAILSYTFSTNGNQIPQESPWCINMVDKIKRDIGQAKELNADIIIVMPHIGVEYETTTRQEIKDEVYGLLKAGADLVLVTHPHVLQPVESIIIVDEDGTERNCFIAYSLGNFISSQRTPPRDYGMILNLSFSKSNGKKATLDAVDQKPIWVKFISKEGHMDITVLPISELGNSEFDEAVNGLRLVDATRIEDIMTEFTEIFSAIELATGS